MNTRRWIYVVLAVGTSLTLIWALGCDESSGEQHARDGRGDSTTVDGATDGDPPDGMVTDLGGDTPGQGFAPLAPLPAPRSVGDGRFMTSHACETCHSNASGATAMRDRQDRGISQFDLWQSSMMANAARDPLWLAVVSAEVASTPNAAAAIEAKCMTCHAPAAWAEADLNGEPSVSLDLLTSDTARGQLALDGVTCTTCHQIQDQGLGEASTFSGGFVIGDDNEIFGPHADPFDRPMVMHTGYTPVQGNHIADDAGTCATCHTLFTNTLDPDGTPTGSVLPEQTPYLEWLNSAFGPDGENTAACQSCHVPTFDVDGNSISTAIARRPDGGDFPPVDARSPFGRHVFVGGNTLVPTILRDNPDTLSPLASSRAFDATIEAARTQLETATATVEVADMRRTGEQVEVDVVVSNLVGHKLPTGFPSRRVWIEVAVRDGGQLVWRSGGSDDRGRLVSREGAVLDIDTVGGPMEPHHDQIAEEDAVQIYEAVMADDAGDVTYRLMRAANYAKDNRLLPRGYDPLHPQAVHTTPAGVDGDADFAAARDALTYVVTASAGATIEVSLRYQTLGGRFAAELFAVETDAVEALRFYLEKTPGVPETLSTATGVLP